MAARVHPGPLRQFAFEVLPVEGARPFTPFLIELNTDDDEKAARRAWWAAFHRLGPVGYEPEEFAVFEFVEGRKVGPKGFLP